MKQYASFRQRGVLVRVYLVTPDEWEHGSECEGVWLPSNNRIEILNELDPVHIQRVLCHELMHCILDLFNSKMTHDETFVDNCGAGFWEAWTSFRAYKPRRKRKANAKVRK